MAIDPSRSHVLRIGHFGERFVLDYENVSLTKMQVADRFRDLHTSLKGVIGHQRLRVRCVRNRIRISVWFDPAVAIMFDDRQLKQYIGMTEAVVEERLGMDPARDDGIE